MFRSSLYRLLRHLRHADFMTFRRARLQPSVGFFNLNMDLALDGVGFMTSMR